MDIRNSPTYRAIIDTGRELQAKENILSLGMQRFGQPAGATRTALAGITDLNRLRRVRNRLLDAPDWADLLDSDSDTYMAIIEEGRELQVKEDILVLGVKRFGQPDGAMRTALAGITDIDRLERIHQRILRASNWADLLSTP